MFARDERQALKDEQRGKVRKNHGYAAIYSDNEDSDGNDSGHSAKSEEINHAQGDENHEEESNSESEFEDALYMLDRLEEQDEDRKSLEEALSLMHDARSKRRSAQRTFVQARAVVRDIKRIRRIFRPRPKKGAHAATNLSSKIRSRATSNPPHQRLTLKRHHRQSRRGNVLDVGKRVMKLEIVLHVLEHPISLFAQVLSTWLLPWMRRSRKREGELKNLSGKQPS